MRKKLHLLCEFSIPLIAGVISALLWANIDPQSYYWFNHAQCFGPISFHFITNDIFMVFFFAIAAVEITLSCLPGGDLNPISKAINPLLATIGGVLGPVTVYTLSNIALGSASLANGWGIPTATDIAFSWLAARLIFGKNHPAISFLLLLAIADDAIGLGIIAFFYPNPYLPVAPLWLLLTGVGILIAYALRLKNVQTYWPYILFGGTASWLGLFKAHLHPALALVLIVPFLPHTSKTTTHLFEEGKRPSALASFIDDWKVIVDAGLFMFGLANAGIQLSAFGTATWLVLGSLIIGKTVGIFIFSFLSDAIGFSLPKGMNKKHLLVSAVLAGIGFTVAIFIAGEAFSDPEIQGAAKMGAMLSVLALPLALFLAQTLGVKKRSRENLSF